jgi:hypothetical protein
MVSNRDSDARQEQPAPRSLSNADLPNDEWELSELVEWVSVALDEAQLSLSLKALARGMTFGPARINLQLNVFPRFDSQQQKIHYRMAGAGETGASSLTLDMPSLLRDQIQAHGIPFEDITDTRPLTELSGINLTEIARLQRIGVLTVGDLEKMAATPGTRSLVAFRSGVSLERLSTLMQLPFIRSARVVDSNVVIGGAHFGMASQRQTAVLVDDQPVGIERWTDSLIEAKLGAIRQPRVVFIVNEQGTSNVVPVETRRVLERYLVREDHDEAIRPDLATSWDVSKTMDGIEVQFLLRDDVVLADGSEFTAKAAKRILEEDLGQPNSRLRETGLHTLEIVDDHTITLLLTDRDEPELLSTARDRPGLFRALTKIPFLTLDQ